MAALGACELQGCDTLSAALHEDGYWLCDGAASAAFCALLRSEVGALASAGLLRPSLNRVATQRSGSAVLAGEVCVKRGVSELDLVLQGEEQACCAEALALAPTLREWLRDGGCAALLARLQAAAPTLRLTALDTCKLQLNDGQGGCFPLHFDTTAETSQRRLTCILYLSPDWRESDGGELCLFPFPLDKRQLSPFEGRLVLFPSVTLLHRVLPSRQQRACLSLWFAAEAWSPLASLPDRYPNWAAGDDAEASQLLAFLRRPANGRLLCKVLLSEEWVQSIREAFAGGGAAVEEAVRLHLEEAAALAGRVNAPLLSLLRETLPLKQAAAA